MRRTIVPLGTLRFAPLRNILEKWRTVPVRSAFSGWLMGLLVHDGERVGGSELEMLVHRARIRLREADEKGEGPIWRVALEVGEPKRIVAGGMNTHDIVGWVMSHAPAD